MEGKEQMFVRRTVNSTPGWETRRIS